tara:strand:- start:442 stop:666 length:225 start_codon:yes stop_codon:yes gene_type:complete
MDNLGFILIIILIILILIGLVSSVIINTNKIKELNDELDDQTDKFEISKKDIETKFEILSKNDKKIKNQVLNNN